VPGTNRDKIDMFLAFKSITSKEVWKTSWRKVKLCLDLFCLPLIFYYVFFMKNTLEDIYKNDLHRKKWRRERGKISMKF